VTSSQARADIIANRLTVTGINRLRANREIDESDHANLINFKLSLDRHRESAAEHKARMSDRATERQDREQFGRLKAAYLNKQIDEKSLMDLSVSGQVSGRVSGDMAEWVTEQDSQLRNASKAELRRQHAKIEDEVKAEFEISALGTSSRGKDLMDQIYARWQEHFNQTSQAWSDARDALPPREAKDAIMDEYRGHLLRQQLTVADSVVKTLPPRLQPADLNDFASIQEKVNQLRMDMQAVPPRISEGDYYIWAERLRELGRMADRATKEAASPGTPGAPAKTLQQLENRR
jgi:hypothetical protein